ncbi:MAG: biotin--[acetyl-CoA-carboxylase] ligase [Rickettsiales bacterium]|jgi:BirA family biotin operon repressor/biotin-[acetyl-CoA-carboxylase] ligase|nr:biotin--[acetyl-CoA-carboxylase] ligase [Rickettsiales bacterium]
MLNRIHLDTVGSTNDYAKELLQRAPGEYVVTANEQTSGRTTKGDKWYSPRGNLFLSAAIRLGNRRFSDMALVSALTVAEAIDSDAVLVKWPNDILVNVKKACGILVERDGEFAIAGIGVNVIHAPPPGISAYPTTSLAREGIAITAEKLGERIIARLFANLALDFTKIIEGISPRMYRIGKRITILSRGETITGVFEGLDINGGLILDGRTILSGEMTKENFNT